MLAMFSERLVTPNVNKNDVIQGYRLAGKKYITRGVWGRVQVYNTGMPPDHKVNIAVELTSLPVLPSIGIKLN
jgi:hypothetical protein